VPSIVATFDTNILLSGVGWRGNPYRCLELARGGTIAGVTCKELLDELTEKLQSRLNFSDPQVMATIADLLGFLTVVRIPNTLKVVSADPDDDKVLECALIGGATHIVTGDRRHLLPLRHYQGISIVSAADFLTLGTSSS
jgi:uncharacterized protein